VFRISKSRHQVIDVAQVDQIEPAVKPSKARRYHVFELKADPLPSGRGSRCWGVGIKWADGSVEMKSDPREARFSVGLSTAIAAVGLRCVGLECGLLGLYREDAPIGRPTEPKSEGLGV
jgi:hypothetical protein